MDKHLHIICLNVPYPVDYGGVFDLYYKLPALHAQGIRIHLHCFDYGRGEQPVLKQFCEEVFYYTRKTGLAAVSLRYPYIVSSRIREELFVRLLQDNYPILMEGIHCTFLLNDPRFNNRKCFVRLHNVEHIYYRHLYKTSSSVSKKIYFLFESKLLKKYERKIAAKATFLAVSQNDGCIYKALGADDVQYLPLFLPEWKVSAEAGKGSFCLYQADLSVPENEKAARWLVTEVFNDLQIPLVVAGKNPSRQLINILQQEANTSVVANPDEQEMQELITEAVINIIPSFNATGIKLKLINALYNGGHCLVNKSTVQGTGLEPACHIAETAPDFKTAILNLYNQPFSIADIQVRQDLLANMFNNTANARQLIKLIWS